MKLGPTNTLFASISKIPGAVVLRINFPGVRKSDGEIGNGVNEFTAAQTALNWLISQNPTIDDIRVAGISFGGFVAYKLSLDDPRVTFNFSVGASLDGRYEGLIKSGSGKPRAMHFVHGEEDPFVCNSKVARYVQKNPPNDTLTYFRPISGGNHFLSNHRQELSQTVTCAFQRPYASRPLSAPPAMGVPPRVNPPSGRPPIHRPNTVTFPPNTVSRALSPRSPLSTNPRGAIALTLLSTAITFLLSEQKPSPTTLVTDAHQPKKMQSQSTTEAITETTRF